MVAWLLSPMTWEPGWSACSPMRAAGSLFTLVLGDEQVRALHQACRAALTATAAELRPDDAATWDEVAMVVGEVFTTPAPQPVGEHVTLLEDLRAGIAA